MRRFLPASACYKVGKVLTTISLWLMIAALNCKGQVVSNAGTDFWIVFPTHVPDFDSQTGLPALANLSVFLTGKSLSSGTITVGSWRKSFSIEPNKVTEISIPREQAYIDASQAQQVQSGKGIHVEVNSGAAPIVAYAHIFAGNRSAATLILPKESLGQQYYSINYHQTGQQGQNFIAVVAADPNTVIHIRKKGKDLVTGGIMLVRQGDVFEYLSNDDLSGVSVSVDETLSPCSHFALFSGSTGTAITSAACIPNSYDPLFQQCFPVESWGLEYAFIPFSMNSPKTALPVRTAGQYVRIMAQHDQTTVTINDRIVAVLNAGEYFTTPEPLTAPAWIRGTNPVCVAQYALTQNCSQSVSEPLNQPAKSFSDPDMVILNPVEFSIRDITLYSSTREKITEQYLNILIPSGFSSSFQINGKAPADLFKPVASQPGYVYLQLNLNQEVTNTFHLTADGGFNAIAYGFGQLESYAYSAGTNLAGTAALAAYKEGSELPIDSACADDDYFFRLTVPFQSPKISWATGDINGLVVQLAPAFSKVSQNGRPAFQYTLQKPVTFRTPGDRVLKVIADFPTNYSGCVSGAQEITQNFRVIAPPDTRFSFEPADCRRLIRFNDQTTDPKHVITTRHWDFGDPQSGTSNNSEAPEAFHRFSQAGSYEVRLTTHNSAGCQSVFTDRVVIKTLINPSFTFNKADCKNKNIIFQDNSKENDSFKIQNRKWYFGDGDSILVSPAASIAHSYTKTGKFQVKMVLSNAAGCSSDTAYQTVVIENELKAAFRIPILCESDQIAQFINTSQLPADSLSTRYLWQFGDPGSTTDNPNSSTDKNPSHIYRSAGKYVVTLNTISPDGCADAVLKTVIINGTKPKAAFDFLSPQLLCSGQPVLIKDQSAMIDYGNITKIEWYFDIEASPNKKTTIIAPVAGTVYTHIYPFNRTSDRATGITIKLVAFSGNVCADSVTKTFTLLPAPHLIPDSASVVCVNTPPYQLPAVLQTGTLAGNGHYNGKGVSTTGVFNPSSAGVGHHTVKYTFSSPGGCVDSLAMYINVLPSPLINWPSKFSVSPGQKVSLRPTTNSSGLTFRWTPSEGLSSVNVAAPQASPFNTTEYKVYTSNGQCAVERTITVNVLKRPIVPSAFTPNGDGYNDLLNIRGLEDYPEIKVDIYNRYGASIFHSDGYSKGWDGTFNGREMPAGVYYYIISLGQPLAPYSGYVTLIR